MAFILAGLLKIAMGAVRKIPEGKQAAVPLLTALLAKAELLLPDKEKKKEKDLEKDKDSDKDKGSKEPVKPFSERLKAEEDAFYIDQIVVLSAKKGKARFDGKRCRVIRVIAGKLKMEICEGSALGEEKTVLKSAVTIPQDSQPSAPVKASSTP